MRVEGADSDDDGSGEAQARGPFGAEVTGGLVGGIGGREEACGEAFEEGIKGREELIGG